MTASNIIKPSNDESSTLKHRRTPSGGLRLRKNLMLKLGMSASGPKSYEQRDSLESKKKIIPVRSILGSNPNITIEPLNDHEDFESRQNGFWSFLYSLRGGAEKIEPLASSFRSEASSITASSRSETGSEKRLVFNEEVTVCPIPRRDQYSNRIREQLWPNMAEFTKRAESNTLEFASEGWDWRKSLDKEDMYFDVSTGEYIHPIHIILKQQAEGNH